ncbi:MAG TPA: adenylate/guanylate cyclase domain-containing protein [Acidimicrobiales bacterium]
MTCPVCSADAPEGARFCPSCGADLRLRGDQRRVVTVLFADIVGFTSLSEHRDPEQVKRIVDGCFERLVAIIEDFGGRVDKIVGDAILALFGAPIAHEDDAERAVRTALRLPDALCDAAADLGVDARLRVGVNTGEVLVGSLRAGGDYTAMGDVVNTAQRLQSVAEPGQVLVGQATYLATRRVVTYRAVGAIAAKGREAPVEAWVAEGARLPPGHRSDRRRAPLIGRDDEVALLSHALNMAFDRSRPALLLALGDAGLGKSRLAEDVADQARECHGALVLPGRCVPYGEANVWWPVASAIQAACGVERGDDQDVVTGKVRAAVTEALDGTDGGAAVDRVVEGLRHLLGYEVPRGVDAARVREEATGSLLAFTAAVARRRPVVMVLSDLHWADEAVLDVVGGLLQSTTRLPFVVLATARPALAERWSPPEGGHHSVVVHLDPLGRDAATQLLRSLTGDRWDGLDDGVAGELLDRAGGNPFFLEELVSWLGEAGSTEVPDTLRGLVAARLDALTASERHVLEDAAVLGSHGRVGWLAIMQREAHGGEEAVPECLGSLQAKDLLAVDGEAWEFRSELVREVAYGTMTKQRRARVHTGIASWLEREEYEHHEGVIDSIANHYGRAAALSVELGGAPGTHDAGVARAVDWLGRAGRRAARVDTPRRAADLFSEALALLDSPALAAPAAAATARRGELLLARAAAHRELHEMRQARADAEAALELAEALADEPAAVAAQVEAAEVAVRSGAPDEAEALLETALARAGAAGYDQGRAAALRVRGFAALLRNDPDAAVASLEPALEIYTAQHDRLGRAWALQNLSWAHFIAGRIQDAEALLHDSAALFAELGDRGGLGWAMGLLAFTRFHSGYPEEAETMARDVFGAAGEAGDRWAVAMGQVLTAGTRLWTGRSESAIEHAAKALATFDAIDDDYGRVQARLPLGRALVTAGRVDEGFAVLEEARTTMPSSGSPRFTAFSATGLLSAAVQVGDRQRAAAALDILPTKELSSDDLETAGGGEYLVSRALLELQVARPGEALELLRSVSRAIGERAEVGYCGAVTALALAAAGRPDEAWAAAQVVEEDERSTYLDRLWAGLAAGAVEAGRGDRAAVEERFAQLCARVDETEDQIAQALARLGWAMAREADGHPDARLAATAAEERFTALGIDAAGWTAVLGQAAGVEPAAPVPAST